jgi:positive regulator of sigma E activity
LSVRRLPLLDALSLAGAALGGILIPPGREALRCARVSSGGERSMRVTEDGRVVSIEGGKAAVAFLAPEDGDKCTRCPEARSCSNRPGRKRVLVVTAPDGLEVGDAVTVAIEGASPAWAAFVLLILPLAVAFACGLGAWALTGSAPTGVVGGMLGAAGVFIAIRFTRAGARGSAEIVKVHKAEDD